MERRILILIWLPLTFGWFLLQQLLRAEEPEYVPQFTNAEEQQMATFLSNKGFRPEADPQGNLALGYGCISVQRRGSWAAIVRGHSRYFWAAEHYLGANLYGRYLAHGSMQLLTAAPGVQ